MYKYSKNPLKNIIKKITIYATSILFFALNHTSASTTIIPVVLPNNPLHSTGTVDKPTITLALSVEFPTVGSLYRDNQATTDNSFKNEKEYIGYFYTKGCYEYSLATDKPSTDQDHYKRFIYKNEVTTLTNACGDGFFKGNLLNWAGSSSIDILRLALSGGDRYIDENGLTILQRAVIPVGNPQVACLWNHGQFFPVKQLEPKNFLGNIPSYLRNKAGNNNLWISSKHNGLYFNTTKPIIRNWNDPCNISTEVTNAQNFIKSIKTGNGANDKVIIPDGFYYARVEVCTKTASGSVEDFKDFNLCDEQPNGNYKPTGVIQKYSNNLRVAAFGYALEHKSTRYGGVLRAPMRYIGPKHYDAYGKEKSTANPYTEWDHYTGIILKNPHSSIDDDIILKSSVNHKFENSGLINYLNKFGRTSSNLSNDSTDKDAASNNNNQIGTHYYGEYKFRDPLSTLYHQALRYLQGLSNIEEATSGLNAKAYDGFPIYANWNSIDPFGEERTSAQNYACLKNNIVTIGDIFPTEFSYKTINSDPASRKVDYAKWKKKALDYEKSIFSNSVSNSDEYNIVGYSYWAHAKDIRGKDWLEEEQSKTNKQRPGLRVKTFMFDVNEKGDSSLYNSRSKSNQLFLAAKYGGYETFENNKNKNYYSVSYSTDQNYSESQIDKNIDISKYYAQPDAGYHPTNSSKKVTTNSIWQRRPSSEIPTPESTDKNSSGQYEAASYYLQGQDGREIIKAFDDIFQDASTQAYSIAQSSSKSETVKSGENNYIYTATYDSASWTGDIERRIANIASNAKEINLTLDKNWNPAQKLNNRNSSTRKIFIGLQSKNQSTINYRAESFYWNNLDDTVKVQLNKASISSDRDSLGEARVNYIRGSRENEKVTGIDAFRIRNSLLGDIINSGVTHSGPPTNKFTSSSYQDFYRTYSNRLPIVLTGANDGMLHAFSVNQGGNFSAAEEIFAYIPSWLSSKLPLLTNKDYIEDNKHQAFVDAPSAVGEAQVNFRDNESKVCGATYKSEPSKYSNCSTDWRTVLVSGTGAGGRGVFALDISKPETFSKDNFLWEFTEADDLDIGYVVKQPKIIKLKISANEYRWFAAVPSGVNNYQSSFDDRGGSGNPSIFLLALDKPVNDKWKVDENYFKITLPFDATLATTLAPGIIDFSMLYGINNEVTHIYAGDLQGNLWKLDFTDGSNFKGPARWNAKNLSFYKNSKNEALPFYIAKTGGNLPTRQPISAAPLLVTGPVVGGIETFYVAFGTGKYLEMSDTSNTNISRTESFYVLYDDNDYKLDSQGAESAISNRSRLQVASINNLEKYISYSDFRWGRSKNNNDSTQKSGWYFDLPENSERVDQVAAHLGRTSISFNSKIPAQVQTTRSICSEDTASSNIYDIDIYKGGGKYKSSNIGILGPSLFLQNEEKTTVGNTDSTGRAQRTVVKEQINTGTKGLEIDKSMNFIEMIGRLSWRQIYNYKELQRSETENNP